MLTQEEQNILKFGKENGKSAAEVKAAIAKYRLANTQNTQSEGYSVREAGGDVKETFLNVGKSLYQAGENLVTRDIRKPNENAAERIVGYGADVFGGIANAGGDLITGAGKLALPQAGEDKVRNTVEGAVDAVSQTDLAQYVYKTYQALPEDTRSQVDNALKYLDGVTTIVAPGVAKNMARLIIENAAKQAGTATRTVVSAASGAVQGVTPSGTTIKGVTQTMQDFASRVPRALEKGKQSVQDAALKSERIAVSTPSVQNAIKVGVPDEMVNTLTMADAPTAKAYRQMLDIADTQRNTIRPKEQPSIVAGKAAEATYDVIEKERRRIGDELGAEVDALSKNTVVDVLPEQRQMRDILRQNGILPDKSGTLQFKGRFTPNERAAIQKVYDLATEAGEKMSPREIRDMDQLFSKLQREARFENVGSVMVRTTDGDKSLFRVMRDIYSNKLDTLSPNIRELNKQYRDVRTLVDDLEDTIFKSGKYETLKGVDQAEFAKVNLRRIMGEAQSTPAYQAILERMDAKARELGYTGARADDLIYFAEELRKLYPESIPKAGFQGGITTGVRSAVMNAADKVLRAGAPDVSDQRAAIRAILDELLAENAKQTP